MMPTATTLKATTMGISEGSMVKIDPKRICWVAPVVAPVVVSKYRNSAARPVAAPRTIPVARSRPRTRCTPMASMAPAPSEPEADEPEKWADADQEGRRPAGRRHVGEGVAGEGLAAQHGEHADDRGHHGHDAPDDQRDVHRLAGEESRFEDPVHGDQRRSDRRSVPSTIAGGVIRLVGVSGDDDDAAVHVEHVDVVAVEPGQHVGADHLLGRPGRRPATGQVDDAVHDRQERVHLVGGEQHRDPLLDGDAVQQRDDLLAGAQVEVGQGLVEKQQPGPGDEGVGDEHPLLFAAREVPDPGVGEALGVDRGKHLVDQRSALGRWEAACRSAARRAPDRPGPGLASACRGRAAPSGGRSRSTRLRRRAGPAGEQTSVRSRVLGGRG